MSEQFKPGQTVFMRSPMSVPHLSFHDRGPWLVVATDGDDCWLKNEDGVRLVRRQANLTTTDPNAMPEPQRCPFCGAKPQFGGPRWVACTNDDCALLGPTRDNPREATEAWNLIRVTK